MLFSPAGEGVVNTFVPADNCRQVDGKRVLNRCVFRCTIRFLNKDIICITPYDPAHSCIVEIVWIIMCNVLHPA